MKIVRASHLALLASAIALPMSTYAVNATDSYYFRAKPKVSIAPKAKLSIAVTGDSSGIVGSVLTAKVNATDSQGAVQFSVGGGSLPPSVSLDENSGEISGVPSSAGIFTAIISARDSVTTAQAQYSVVVEPKALLSIAVTGNSSGIVGSVLRAKVDAADAQGKVQYSVASGSLPPGVSLDKDSGEISGVPAAAGSFNAMVSAKDSSTTAEAQYSVVVAEKLQISGIAAQGMLGVAYSAKFTASGGFAPISLELSSGTLPQGLSFSNGTISGIPTIATTAFNLVITATDAAGNSVDSMPFSILVGSGSPKNCRDVLALGNTQTKSYPIFPDGASTAFGVYCQQTYAGGGWTKIGSFNDVTEATMSTERRNLIKYNEVLILKNDNPSTPIKQVTCHTTATAGFAADGTKGYNCDPGSNISVRVAQGGANNKGNWGIYIGPDIEGPGCNWGVLTQVWGRHNSGATCVAMGTGEAYSSNAKWGTDTFHLYVR